MQIPIAHAAILGAQVWNPYAWMFGGPLVVGACALGGASIASYVVLSALRASAGGVEMPKRVAPELRLYHRGFSGNG